MYKLITDYPVAVNSADHLYPNGTKNDNHTSMHFIFEMNRYFGREFTALDLGCAGGQYVTDVLDSGNHGLGLEGSDYNKVHGQYNWPDLEDENLFTCDISKPFSILWGDHTAYFDLVTAWEVLEHLTEDELVQLFTTVRTHIKTNGMFLVTIGYKPNPIPGTSLDHHVTQMGELQWIQFLSKYWRVSKYPFEYAVRGKGTDTGESFLFRLDPK
jgi:hypothetical protein